MSRRIAILPCCFSQIKSVTLPVGNQDSGVLKEKWASGYRIARRNEQIGGDLFTLEAEDLT